MRKYTQLCLVLITAASVAVLLVYRNEYKQLKYVLEVVNFISRKDEIALVRLENHTKYYGSEYEFDNPVPIWQRIGKGFHAYSSFWIKQSLKSGGELITIAVGLKHSIVGFKCQLKYENQSVQTGKFVFIREDVIGSNDQLLHENFIVYKFVCKVTKNFGVPKYVIFTDTSTKAEHSMRVRNLESKHIKELGTTALCVDMISMNQTDPLISDLNILQYFFHHNLIGIDEFLVYDSDVVSASVRNILQKNGITLNLLPFNFPFETGNDMKIQKVIETDCLLRTANSIKYSIVSTPKHYIYPNENLKDFTSVLKILRGHAYQNDYQFEIVTNRVCHHPSKKILSDNLYYNNSGWIDDYRIILYKTNELFNTNYLNANSMTGLKIQLKRNDIFNNEYGECRSNRNNQNDEDTNLQWRSTVSHPFQNYVDKIGIELNGLLKFVL